MYERKTSLGYLINQAARLTHKTMRLQLGPSSPHPAYLPIMLWLLEQDGQTQAELCRRARMEQPSMAEIVKRMERDGLILRRPDENDKRRQKLYLSKKAKNLSENLTGWLDEHNAVMRKGVSNRDLAILLSALQQVIANMEAYADQVEES